MQMEILSNAGKIIPEEYFAKYKAENLHNTSYKWPLFECITHTVAYNNSVKEELL